MNDTEIQVKLTQLSKGSGCGCKIEPAVLEKILNENGDKLNTFQELIGGYETKDDAAVWDLGNGNCLLSTTDFFTPIVDDPFSFGKISAANALSDIYAMGGKPSFALAILGYPVDKIPIDMAKQILEGARYICRMAGIPIAGGHSIDISEPVFGLVVNGFVKKEFLMKNSGAKENDLLFLTKPIGTGIMASAMKREKISRTDQDLAIDVMTRLNVVGERISRVKGVHAITDVTGFGLLGHLIEMCEASDVSAELDFKSIPIITGASVYIDQFIFPDNTYRNWNAYEKKVSGITGPAFVPLCDPQTSGGLLIAASPESEEAIKELLTEQGLAEFKKSIGTIVKKSDKVVHIIE